MKKLNCLLIIIFMTAGPCGIKELGAASEGGFSAGIIVGEPTGITFRYNNFPVVGIGWSFNNHFHLHCDYWIYNGPLISGISLYAGAGGKFIHYNDADNNKNRDGDEKNYLGVRIPVGLQFYPIRRLEIFGEIVPGMLLAPSTEFDLDGGIGVRYRF